MGRQNGLLGKLHTLNKLADPHTFGGGEALVLGAGTRTGDVTTCCTGAIVVPPPIVTTGAGATVVVISGSTSDGAGAGAGPACWAAAAQERVSCRRSFTGEPFSAAANVT